MTGALLANLKRIGPATSQRRLKKREYTGRHISCRITAIFLAIIVAILLSLPGMNEGNAASDTGTTEIQEWRYLRGNLKPPQKWNHEEYDDSRWIRGSAGTGYGKRHSAFFLDDMKGRYMRVYARRVFNINYPQAVVNMSLSVVCDGPFVAYLNGVPAIRNIMGLPATNPARGSPIGEELDLSGWVHELNPGLNVLAIQCDNDDISSNDFLFIPFLKIIEGHDAK